MVKVELIDKLINSISHREGVALTSGYYERMFKDYYEHYTVRELKVLYKFYKG